MAKKTSKKTTAKKTTAKKAVHKARSGGKVDEAIKLMKRANGATLADFAEVEFNQPAMTAVKAAERRGLKVEVRKEEGEYKRYVARQA
jgi:hypothetical protein